MNLQKFIIFSTILVEVLGISIIIPAFPELKLFYGINDLQVTLGLAVYSIFSFMSAPVLWQISDRIGRKWPLAWCIAGTMLSYVVLLFTQNYWIFLISRAINGITGGNIAILQAILTDISPDRETKNKNYGLMGAFFGLGFIIGPVIGALCLRYGDVTTIFWTGAILGLFELVLIVSQFSNTNHPAKSAWAVLNFNSFGIIAKYVRKPRLRNLLLSLFALWVGGFIVNSSLSLYMDNKFSTSGEEFGYYLAILWVITALNMAVLLPKFWSKILSNKNLILLAHIVFIIWFLIVGYIASEWIFITMYYVTILLSWYYMPIYTTTIMTEADPQNSGEISGMLAGAQSLFMFVWPIIGGLMLTAGYNIFVGATVCFVISLALMMRYFVKDHAARGD